MINAEAPQDTMHADGDERVQVLCVAHHSSWHANSVQEGGLAVAVTVDPT